MKAPFVYFGGKAAVASFVWDALGQPKHYIEPFFGSGAVLLNRPNHDPSVHVESINDKDGFISNVWRSLKFSPEKTAEWADWPVNHADLSARKRALIANEKNLLENLILDDEWHDPKMAGYWIWAASCWIGSGLTYLGQIPHISNGGKGVHKLSAQVHIYEWFDQLSARLRHVRVVCGDWTRVCGGNWQDNCGTCGIFFDPPYSDKAERNDNIYHQDNLAVAHDVREWCIERGDKKTYRIVLAGYYDEHESLISHGWTAYKWKAQGGYANASKNETKGDLNKLKETLFFSPHCLNNKSGDLFDSMREEMAIA